MNVRNQDRISKILLGRPAGGRLLPACVQLSLIYAWHLLLSFALVFNQGWLTRLNEHAQRFWFRHGLSIGVANHETISNPNIPVLLWHHFISCLILILLEALVMWIIFRLAIRRPRPKWNHFIRYWWNTCLYSTVILIIMEILSVVLPSQLFISPFFAFSPGTILMILIGLFFMLMPAVLSCREVSKRAIRISPLCPICKYWLHMLSSPKTSEQ